jgi:hypothetical protein
MLDPVRELSRSPGLASDRASPVEPTTVQVGIGVTEDGPAALGVGACVVGGALELAAGGAVSEGWLPPQATPTTRRDPRLPATNAFARLMSNTEP